MNNHIHDQNSDGDGSKFDLKWSDICQTISKVVQLEGVDRKKWNDSFSDVYALCMPYPVSYADQLNDHIDKFFIDHVENIRVQLEKCGRRHLLREYSVHWNTFNDGVRYLNNLFSALNSRNAKKGMFDSRQANRLLLSLYGLLGDESKLEVSSMALKCWLDKLVTPLNQRLVDALIEEMQGDRQEVMYRRHIHDLKKSYIAVESWQVREQLSHYTHFLEAPILQAEREYYRNEATARITDPNSTIGNYILWARKQLKAASEFGRQYLHPGTQFKLCREIEDRLLVDYLDRLKEEAIHLINKEAFEELSTMYRLFKDVPEGLSGVSEHLQSYFTKQGMNVIHKLKTSKNFQDYISNFLKLHTRYLEITDKYFSDSYSKEAMDNALIIIVNSPEFTCDGAKAAEILAKQCDAILRKGSKIVSDAEIDERLTHLVTIFSYVDGKDIFLRFYSRNLANRLINSTYISQDSEENMIQKLKACCGYSFTNKLQRMLQDIRISEDLRLKFQLTAGEKNILKVLVLQSGSWPVQKRTAPSFLLPQELTPLLNGFEKFYHSQFTGRTLQWLHYRSTMEVAMSYLKNKHVVVATTYQASILLLFNKQDQINYEDVDKLYCLPLDDISKTISSLVEAKILLEETDSDSRKIFKLNMNYSNKHFKFKITSIMLRDTPVDRNMVHHSINEDRKIFVQAAIVRIMKARKLCTHGQLISEVVEQSKSRFQPNIPIIKKCIEILMEKQYLERSEEDKNEYRYCA